MKRLFSLLAIILISTSFGMAKPGEDFPADIKKLMTKYTCIACHKVDARLVGPAYTEVAKKGYSVSKIVYLIANPQPSNWPGYPPMAALKNVPKEDAIKIAKWINSLK